VWFSGSTRIPFIADRSMTMPPSHSDWPGKLWPPLRTATGRPVRFALSSAAATSATPVQYARRAGNLLMDPFQMRRASS
jgi:hypothetical protein